MEVFSLTLRQMLMMFALIVAGIILKRKRLLPDNAHIVMSRMETYVLVPAILLYAQLTKCTPETFRGNSHILLYGCAFSIAGVLLAYPLSRLFVRRTPTPDLTYQRSLYTYALSIGNYASIGNLLILGIWGADVFYQYSLYTFFAGIVCNSWGLYVLIPKDQGSDLKANLRKGLFSPPTLSLLIGMTLGILNLTQYIPEFLLTAVENAGNCQGPVAMLLAGFVIGGYNFRELISNGKVLLLCMFRLVLIPAAMLVVLRLLGAGSEILLLTLVCYCTPIGLNTIVFPSAYGGDTKTGASMTMLSHALSVATIPLMVLLFSGWLLPV